MTGSPCNGRGSAPGFAFATCTFERASERREDLDWVTALRQDPRSLRVIVAADGRVLLTPDGKTLAREPLDAADDPAVLTRSSLLGFEDGRPLFAKACATPDPGPAVETWSDLRSIAAALSAYEAGIAAYARALLYWQSRTRFCGSCGAAVELMAAGHRGSCVNVACRAVHFPRTDAAAIVLVEHQGRALLGRQAEWGAHRFSTLAGFVELGETLEDTVRREVREESGVRVGAVVYQASQPWPFPSSLMIGFRAQALDDAIEVGDEIVEARWFSPADIDRERETGTLKLSPPLSISRWLLGCWYRERTGRDLVD